MVGVFLPPGQSDADTRQPTVIQLQSRGVKVQTDELCGRDTATKNSPKEQVSYRSCAGHTADLFNANTRQCN